MYSNWDLNYVYLAVLRVGWNRALENMVISWPFKMKLGLICLFMYMLYLPSHVVCIFLRIAVMTDIVIWAFFLKCAASATNVDTKIAPRRCPSIWEKGIWMEIDTCSTNDNAFFCERQFWTLGKWCRMLKVLPNGMKNNSAKYECRGRCNNCYWGWRARKCFSRVIKLLDCSAKNMILKKKVSFLYWRRYVPCT